MSVHPVSRLAPTPSGYLHLGNVFNFLYTWAWVRREKGRLILRIDDMDHQRCRLAYVEDIFRVIDWLGIDYDAGPSGVDDFYRTYSIRTRLDYYREALATLQQGNAMLYACDCSRKQIAQAYDDGIYRGQCRTAQKPFSPEHNAVRIAVPAGTVVPMDGIDVALERTLGDFVLWRRDDTPAYQFASVIDDRDLGVDLIVRGEDLRTSSAAQRWLASQMGITAFASVRIVHHGLLPAKCGGKLSKSDGALSLHAMIEGGITPAEIYRRCATFFGSTAPVASLEEFQACFDASHRDVLR